MTLAAPMLSISGGPTRSARVSRPLGAALGLGLAAAALQVRDPHQHGSWGFCPFKALTGWDCPACGGLRAVNDLGSGDLVAAAHSNVLLVAAVPVFAIVWALWFGRAWSGSEPTPAERAADSRRRRTFSVALAVLLVVFTILRNTPLGSTFHAA